MNRIILIGNGFDLAHKLETSYKSFISYYWDIKIDKIFLSFQNKRLFIMNNEATYSLYEYVDDPEISIKNISDRYSLPTISNINETFGYNKFLLIIKYLKNYNNENVSYSINNSFLKKISDIQKTQKWVDVEEEYYLSLLECKEQIEDIKILNSEFITIQNALEKYLHEEYEKKKEEIKVIPKLDNILKSDILKAEVPSIERDGKPNETLFLNFNYTNTIEKYHVKNDKTRIINIHGELKSENNPIIFGYGDDIGEQYKDIEKINKNDFLLNMKSIKYSKNNNYRDMLAFANLDDYQVYILGHSCGISDRTLLNTLFEHDNCKSIKIYYYVDDEGNDNYLDTFINLSRNFNNKARMREIVVSQENSETMV